MKTRTLNSLTILTRAMLGAFSLMMVLVPRPADAANLYTLSPSQPPELVRLNHESNLKLLDAEHADLLKQLVETRDRTLRGCLDGPCRIEANRRYASDVALEEQRHKLAVERENAAFNVALNGAEDRLKQEEEARQARLAEQARQIKVERDKLQDARNDERKESIQQAAGENTLGPMVQSGDAVVLRPEGNPYGDVSSRFKAKRRSYPHREWTPTPPKKGTPSRDALEREKARMEALVHLYPDRSDLRERLKEISAALEALTTVPAPPTDSNSNQDQ